MRIEMISDKLIGINYRRPTRYKLLLHKKYPEVIEKTGYLI